MPPKGRKPEQSDTIEKMLVSGHPGMTAFSILVENGNDRVLFSYILTRTVIELELAGTTDESRCGELKTEIDECNHSVEKAVEQMRNVCVMHGVEPHHLGEVFDVFNKNK